jgi:hypothetical protein
MGAIDWLFLIYIFKWANFWVAPSWVFTALWILFGIRVVAHIIKEVIEKLGRE